MTRETSGGGVLVRRMKGRWWMVAITPRRDRPKKDAASKPVLALPKGLVDPGERPEQTALREAREETGLEAALVAKLGDIRYVYVRSWGDGQRVFKIVSFYLLRHRRGRTGQIAREMRHEVEQVRWLPLDEAPRLLTYSGERQMALKATEYLKGSNIAVK